jgi:glycosyltransferase involved in cell wall biosynthesis
MGSVKTGTKYQFNNRNGFGDIVLATCLPRDIKNSYVCEDCGYEFVALKTAKCRSCEQRIKEENETRPKDDQLKYIPNVKKKFNWLIRMQTTFPMVWKHNPWLDDFAVEDQTIPIGPGMGTQMSNSSGLHASNNYRISVENALRVTIPQGPPYPDLHLSESEKSEPPEIDRRYWLITRGGKEDYTSKIWPYDRWQEVVDALPQITFVQIGLRKHFHPPLQGANVINMVGQTEDREEGIRRLFKMFYHCDGSLGLVSAHMHIAAAFPFHKPCVVVAGAREPSTFEQYHFHRYISNGGWLLCPKDETDERTVAHANITTSCWRKSVCACPRKIKYNYEGIEYHVCKCLDMITAADVVRGVLGYYEGGRLAPIEEQDAKRIISVPKIPDEKLDMPKFAPKVKLGDLDSDLLRSSKVDGAVLVDSPPVFIEPAVADPLDEIRQPVGLEQLKAIREERYRRQQEAASVKDEDTDKDAPVKLSLDGARTAIDAEAEKLAIATDGVEKEAEPIDRCVLPTGSPKTMKILCNAHTWGGGERSATTLMNLMINEGFEVHLYPSKFNHAAHDFAVGYEFGLFLEQHPEIVVYSSKLKSKGELNITDKCNLFLLYANDLVYSFNQPRFVAMARLRAKRKIMILNYKIGKTAAVIWARHWDKYGFLCNTLRSAFVRVYPESRTFVLAPPVENQPFLDRKLPPFEEPFHFVRVSSQGDAKHPQNTNEMIDQIRVFHPDAQFSFMPAPSFLDTSKPGIFAYQKNEIPVIDFLSKGNIFWYPLPSEYTDQGPRVLVEAMSLGLPGIADNRDGAMERIVHGDTGWLCNSHSEYAKMVKDMIIEDLYSAGKRAKERAARIWRLEHWVDQILGDDAQ